MCYTTPVCIEYIITSLSFSKCCQEWKVPSLQNETATDIHSSPHQREPLSAFACCKDTPEACPACVGDQAEAVPSQDEVPRVPAESPWSEGAAELLSTAQESWGNEGFGSGSCCHAPLLRTTVLWSMLQQGTLLRKGVSKPNGNN